MQPADKSDLPGVFWSATISLLLYYDEFKRLYDSHRDFTVSALHILRELILLRQ